MKKAVANGISPQGKLKPAQLLNSFQDVWQFDSNSISGLKTAEPPKSAAELCEFVHCMQWMASSIPDFVERVVPLKESLEEVYRRAGARTKKSIQKISLASLSWNDSHVQKYFEFQKQLRNVVKLAHRDTAKALCIYTDASEEYWSGVLTQTNPEELDIDIEKQRHEPLAFLGAAFKRSGARWATFEKESFAIYQVFKKLDYMLLAEGNTHLYTDHRNLLFVFNPLALNPALARHVVSKVQRWGLYLSRFAYAIEHVQGEKNIMAYIMTRWWRGYRGKRQAIKRISHVPHQRDIAPSPLSEQFSWPDEEIILMSQDKYASEACQSVKGLGNVPLTHEGKLWIPENDAELQIKLLVVSQSGAAGHRAKLIILKETYHWKTMSEDCSAFISMCLHCLVGKSGHRILRPIALTLHATRPNEIIHFDFLYMGAGLDGFKYILVVKDDLSSYQWLTPARCADADTAATEIAKWIRTFTIMTMWVSDQGSYFKNNVMKTLAEDHRIKHNFTVAYSPWVNGTVESCMKHVLAANHGLQSELKLGPQDWPAVTGMIQTALNEVPLRPLGAHEDGTFRTPQEFMTGIKPTRTISHTTQTHAGNHATKTLTKLRAIQVLEIERLQNVFDQMHKVVAGKVSKNWTRPIRQHNKRTNLAVPNFRVGDFVLVRRAQDKGHKQTFRWLGPRRVVDIVGELV